MPTKPNPVLNILDAVLKLASRRREARPLARTFAHLRDEVLAHRGSAAQQEQYFCTRLVQLVKTNGVERLRPMTEYGERLADYENAIARFTSTGHSHGPTMAERRAFVAARAADVGRRLPGDDIDLIANARKKSTMAMRFVFHLYGEPDGMKHDPPRFTSYEEFSRSVKRALQR